MIRRKVSTGLLRASKSSGSLRSTALAQASAAPASVSQQQTASLASATLLSSQRNWGKETVVTLKGELKKRGLSQMGNKSVLIDRLKSADTSALLPPVPSTPSKAAPVITRQMSSSAPLSKKKAAAESATPKSDDVATSAGPTIETQKSEAPKTAPIEPEQASATPGLPATRSKGDSSLLNIKFPTPPEEKIPEQVIPVEPDNFRTQAAAAPEPTKSTAKVVTVASSATHPEGGPKHALHESVDAHQLEAAEEEVAEVATGVWNTLNLSAALPAIGAPHGEFKGEEYKASSRALDGNERKGLWALAGIIGLGLFAGGSGKKEKKSSKSGKDGKEAAGKDGKSGSKVVAGDAKWEKASGAEIVGHGARKE